MPTEVPDSDLPDHLKAASRAVPASDMPDTIKPSSIASGLTGPPAPDPTFAQHPIARGAEEIGRTVALGAGEYVGGSIGAGVAGTTADTLIDLVNKHFEGLPVNIRNDIAKDFLINMGASFAGAGLGKLLNRAIPREQDLIRGAVDKATQTAGNVKDEITQKGTAAIHSLATTQKSQLGAVSDEAKIEAIQRTTGRSAQDAIDAEQMPLEARSEVSIPSTETLTKQGGPRGVYFGVKQRISDHLGQQYEKLLGRYGQNVVEDTSGIGAAASYWKSQFPDPPAALKKILERAEDLGSQVAKGATTGSSIFQGKGASKGAVTLSARDWARLSGGKSATDTAPTVARLLGLKRDAQALMVKSGDPKIAEAAEEIANSAYTSLGKIGGLPEDAQRQLSALNSSWRDYRNMFPHGDVRGMATTRSSMEAADKIFNSPSSALTDRIISGAKGEERTTLQNAFGDWAQRHPEKLLAKNPVDALAKAQRYYRLFPGTIFGDPQAITYLGATLENISQAPAQQKLFQAAMQQSQQNAVAEGAKAVRDIGLKAADKLGGPAGKQLQGLIKNAPNSEEAASRVVQFFTKMDPQKFIQQIGAAQESTGQSVARQIVKPDDESKTFYLIDRMKNDPKSWLWMAGIGGVGMTMMFGHPGFMGMMAGAGTVPALQRITANMFVKGLKNPAMAASLLKGAQAARLGIMRPFATLAMRATADEIGNRLGQRTWKSETPEAEGATSEAAP